MNFNGKAMVAVAMMMGSMAVMGCSKPADQASEAVAPEETPATAPVDGDTSAPAKTPGVEQDSLRFGFYAPVAPPVVRIETPGRAPSERHFWTPGYYRWTGREHAWVGGRWELRREGYNYVGPRWENRQSRWQYLPGRWVRR